MAAVSTSALASGLQSLALTPASTKLALIPATKIKFRNNNSKLNNTHVAKSSNGYRLGKTPSSWLNTQTHPQKRVDAQSSATAPLSLTLGQSCVSITVPFKENFRERIEEVELSVATIEKPLTLSYYKEKFNNLICWEEKEHIDILRNRCDGEYELVLYDRNPPDWIARSIKRKLYNNLLGYIQGLDSNQIAYATQASEAAFIINDELSETEVRAELLSENFNHNDDNLYIELNSSEMRRVQAVKKPLRKVVVEFELKHSFFNNLVRAVNALPMDVIKAKLFPSILDFQRATYTSCSISLPLVSTLDKQHQLNALKMIVSNPPNSPPVLVCGSFGSGKTRVLAISAYYLIEQGKLEKKPVRILLCAHHQASADTFIESYFGPLISNEHWSVNLVRLTSSQYFRHSKKYSKMYITTPCFGRDHRQSYDSFVVVTTFHTSHHLSKMFSRDFFTHILLDEGAQVREPEAIVPLCMASPKTHIVVAGDPCQVGPSLLVLGEEAREHGLKYSLLERLMTHYQTMDPSTNQHIATLSTNYRCHADILAVPQKLFYGPLECRGPKVVHPLARYPLTFVCSSVSTDVGRDGNEAEARYLLEEAQRLTEPLHWPREWGPFNLEEICFVTTTRPQLVLLRSIARAEYKMFEKAKMLTTYNIQGQEFRALFLSTFECYTDSGDLKDPTKSSCDRYVFNTVITRAKSLVVCVGNPLVLLKIEEQMVLRYGHAGRCWSEYISNCFKYNTIKVPKSVIPSSRTKKKFRHELKVLVSDASTSLQKQTATLALKQINCQLQTTAIQTELQEQAKILPKPQATPETPATRKQAKSDSPNRIAAQQPSVQTQKAASAAPTQSKIKHATQTTTVQQMSLQTRSKQDTTNAASKVHTVGLAQSRSPNKTAEHQTSVIPQNKKTSAPLNRSPFTIHTKVNTGPSRSKIQQKEIADVTGRYGIQESVQSSDLNPTHYPTLAEAAKVKTKKVLKEFQQSTIDAVSTPHSAYYMQHKTMLGNDDALLQSDLTPQNYREKFHHLLCWEEKEHDDLLSKKCNGEYSITVFQKGHVPYAQTYDKCDSQSARYGYISSLESNSGDTMSYIKQASVGVYIEVDSARTICASFSFGSLPKGTDSNSIILKFSCSEVEKTIKKYNREAKGMIKFNTFVKFELKHTYFQRLHEAVDRLPHVALMKIFPSKAHFENHAENSYVHVPKLPQENLDLDRDQMRALTTILNSSCDVPVLVVGPFGTGKTRLLARAALHLLRNNKKTRVLICAHHQASADTFIDYLGESLERGLLQSVRMVRLIPNNRRYHSSTYNSYEYLYKTSQQVAYNLNQFRLVVTTLGTAPHLFDKRKNCNYFTHILIDEGAQTREPEMLSPLCFVEEKTKIVIAGDHCQVGPQLLVLGEKARNNGLAMSLLERLHQQYDLKDVSRRHSATLLTNYRCHSGILMLASSLFYGSTLQCRVPDSSAHPKIPYPLLFFSSSLDSTVRDVAESTNYNEANILLNQVDLLVRSWPEHLWGTVDLEQICIMTPSPNQKSLVDKLIYKKYKTLSGIEVLKAYEIQGREFRAVFIGTSEVCSNNKTKNPTKSTCDPFVFNTALTRSQSLVVAVGNPFLLLSMERESGSKCWKEYLRRCIECRTFSLPSDRNQTQSDVMEHLFREVYDDRNCSDPTYITKLHDDSILDAYRKQFEKIPECTATKLMLSSRNSGLVWNMYSVADSSTEMQNSETHSEEYTSQYECYLNIRHHNDVVGIPLDCAKKAVEIKGINNRKGAFDGDKVLIGVFRDSPEGKCYGKVIRVIAHLSELKFMCSIHHDNPILFAPVDKKNPIIVNLPRLSHKLISQKNVDALSSELNSADVVVFAANSISEIKEGCLPQIKEVIPLSVARQMLFLVCVLKWDPKYRTPLGIVIEAFPKGYTAFEAERLIKTTHNVVYNDSEGAELTSDMTVDTSKTMSLPLYTRCFTIDPENAQNLDDALSLLHIPAESGKNCYQLGVHITNTALHIQEGSEIDISARKKGVSFYGGEEGKIMHMLPVDIRKKLSLTPNHKCDVLSVVAVVKIESNTIQFSELNVQQAEIESSMQLTYKSAQLIMEGKKCGACSTQLEKFDASTEQPSLSYTLKLLYRIALHLRTNRIGDEALCYEVSEAEVVCWQTHMLVEELMIWANSQVANQIHAKYLSSALLRCQAPPNNEDLAALVGLHNLVMVHSPSLSQHVTDKHHVASPPLMIPRCLVAKIKEAIIDNKIPLLINLLTSDRLYPQLACVQAQLKSLQSRAEYCCTSDDTDPSKYQHFSLHCEKYTHFTSPMRRYLDIQVQRMLLLMLSNDQEGTFTHEKHQQLCLDLNRQTQSSSRFEKSMSSVNFAQRLVSSSEVYDAFLIPGKYKGEMELCFPNSGLNLQVSQRRLKLKHLGPFENKKDTSTKYVYKWRLKITSHSANQGLEILYNPQFSEVEETKERAKDFDHTSQMCIHLDVFCHNEDDKRCLRAVQYDAAVVPDLIPLNVNDRQAALKYVKDPSRDNLDQLKTIFGPLNVDCYEMQTKNYGFPSPFVFYNLTRTLAPYDVLKVWISWSMHEAFLSPCIQLVKLAPGVHVCVQHTSSPAECFSSQILSNASKMRYLNVEEYISLWERVLLAEAAQKSIRENKLIIIKDVCLQWPKLITPANAIDKTIYYEPQGMVHMELPPNFMEECQTFFKFRVGDLVCIRYGTESTDSDSARAVFHMVVQKCADEKVYMKSIGVNCRVSEKLKNYLTSACEIQLIPLSTPHQRIYKGLLRLKESNDLSNKGASNLSRGKTNEQRDHKAECSYLAVHVALGDINPASFKVPGEIQSVAYGIMRYDISATSLWHAEKKILNPVQVTAVELAIENRFQLIQGPPGTGKSETGAHIAYIFARLNRQLKNGRCVLYCGPSNKSVDVVLKNFDVLLQRKQIDLKILRIYSRGVEKKDMPYPGNTYQEHTQDYLCPTFARKYALHYIIRSGRTTVSKKLIQLERNLCALPMNSVLSSTANKELKQAIELAEKAVLKQTFDIMFCTCNEASSSRIPKPCQCIIDECGMAYEPESIIPICLCDHVVLLGDHKQLQPVIEHLPAKIKGLSVSLFERYARHNFTKTLTIQYRMHDKVCEFPSIKFYDGQLETAKEVQNRNEHETNLKNFWIRGSNVPILFCNVVGEEGHQMPAANTKMGSKCNGMEAAKAVEIACVLHHVHKVKLTSIALLTPYTAQKELIKKYAETRNIYKDSDETVKIISVTESQGDEYGIVILSTVRSLPIAEICNPKHVQADRGWLLQNLGFLTDEHQINVGITRSKYGLVIVGNMKLLEYDQTWNSLIDHYKKNHCVVDGKNFPRPKMTVNEQETK